MGFLQDGFTGAADGIRGLGVVGGGLLGAAVGLVVVATIIGLVARRRSQRRRLDHSGLKTFLLPKTVKPVISLKSAAGPGGLKKSPSPVQSPEQPEKWLGVGAASETAQSLAKSQDLSQSSSSPTLESQPSPNGPGRLRFALRYVAEKSALEVGIKSGSGLCSGDGRPPLDPYVKLQLLPEKQHKVKTRVVKGTSEPEYDEEFTFYGLAPEALKSTTLHFVVVAFDRYSRDEVLGEVLCPLVDIKSLSAVESVVEMELQSRLARVPASVARGELLTSLCYQPANNKLTLVVLKARNLPKFDITGTSDPYVKIYLLYNGQRIAKKKTHVKKRTLSPVYNESFVFDVPGSELESVSLELMLMDWDRVTRNEVMGRCEIGVEATSATGKTHWDQVRHNPRRQFAEWHRLSP